MNNFIEKNDLIIFSFLMVQIYDKKNYKVKKKLILFLYILY